MRKFITVFIILSMMLPLCVHADTTPSVSSQTAVLIDADTGQVLYSKDMNAKMYPASITKILTAIIVLNKCSLSDKVTVGHNPPREDGTRVGIMEGEVLTVEDLLYSMLLESANDSALALAEHVSGDKDKFAEIMNETAKNIGCTNSHFVNPNGLTDDNHYTCAYDFALIAKKAMENETFRKIVTTLHYEIKPTNMHSTPIEVFGKNKLLTNSYYKYKWATGIKNGYTSQALNTLVSSASKDGMNLIAVNLKAAPYTIYEDAITLFNYGFDNYCKEKIVSKDVQEGSIIIKNNIKIPVYPSKDFYITKLKNSKAAYTKNIKYLPLLKSIHKNDVVGYIEVKTNDNVINSIPLVSGVDCNISNLVYKSYLNTGYHFVVFPMIRTVAFISIIVAAELLVLKVVKKHKEAN